MSHPLDDPDPLIATTPPRSAAAGPSGGRCPTPDGDLRRVFGQHIANTAVVTTCDRSVPVGLLITSLASVSTRPPVVSFSVSATSWAWPALERARYLGIHLLAAGQEELADRCSAGQVGRSRTALPWRSGPYGVPLLEGCAAWTVAEPKQLVHTGNHVIVVADLLCGDARDDAAALFTHAGSYHQLAS